MTSARPAEQASLRGLLERGAGVLVIAHPGHELRLHGWLEQAQPVVHVLTDGSGRSGRSRLDSTTAVLRGAGAAPGSLYGRFSDGMVYAALVAGDVGFFLRIVDDLAAMLLEEEVAYVVADAAEGYNPTHDVCRLVIDAATARASRVRGRLLTSFDFPLVGRPDACPQELRGEAVAIQLGDAELARKLTAARGYDGLEAEVSEAVNGLGTEVFRMECLRPVRQSPWLNEPASPPFYERHGQDRVRAGHYRRVVRYRDHIRPLVEALRRERERSL